MWYWIYDRHSKNRNGPKFRLVHVFSFMEKLRLQECVAYTHNTISGLDTVGKRTRVDMIRAVTVLESGPPQGVERDSRCPLKCIGEVARVLSPI